MKQLLVQEAMTLENVFLHLLLCMCTFLCDAIHDPIHGTTNLCALCVECTVH